MRRQKTLILGGVRSGKSRLAEHMAIESQLPVTYIATGTAEDNEMHQRIKAHQRRRPKSWHVIEEPVKLASVLANQPRSGQCILIDCLTLWLSNLLMMDDAALMTGELADFLMLLPTLSNRIIIVSNETNMGIIPTGALSRRYCDEAGRLHQQLAQYCDQVILTVAGLPQVLKGASV